MNPTPTAFDKRRRLAFSLVWVPGVCALSTALALGCGGSDDEGDPCALDDADGVTGGQVSFDVDVNDDGFSPTILAAQDSSQVTLTLHNTGTKPHSFVIDCMATPNPNGCPATSCFADEATVAVLDPGASGTALFEVPRAEGIHYFHSDVSGDTDGPCMAGSRGCGQFIVK